MIPGGPTCPLCITLSPCVVTGDAFTVDHIVGNVDICSLSLKKVILTLVQWLLLVQVIRLYTDLVIWYTLMFWLMDGFVNLSIHRYELMKSSCKMQGRRVP